MSQKNTGGNIMKSFYGFLMVGLMAFFLLASCATVPSRWSDTDAFAVKKGLTSEKVLARFGEPDSRSGDLDGNQVWEYRKATESRSTINSLVSLGSFGMLSKGDSMYVDILEIVFKNNKVVRSSYKKNSGFSGLNHGGDITNR